MKVLLLTRRNVGMIALSWLVAKGHEVSVISDDEDVEWLGERLGCEKGMMDENCDMILSVHWHKIIPKEYLDGRIAINIHPCLREGYYGKNPVERYIRDRRAFASISSHYMTEEVDEGEEIASVSFRTGVITSFASFYNIAFKEYYYLLDKTFKMLGV